MEDGAIGAVVAVWKNNGEATTQKSVIRKAIVGLTILFLFLKNYTVAF